MSRLLLAAVAVAALALLCSSAEAAAPLPYTAMTPSDGALFPEGSEVPFEIVSTPGRRLIYVEVSTEPTLGQDGTLANDFVVGSGQLIESDATPGTYRGTSGYPWTMATGSYYWQAHYDGPGGLEIGPVRRFNIDTVFGPREARAALPSVIRDATGRSSRLISSRCRATGAAHVVNCRARWVKGRRYEYRGVMRLRDRGAEGLDYRFTGRRAARSCVKRRSFRTCARRV